MKSKEAVLQMHCINWFRCQYPKEVIFAIPNGGSRNIIEASNLKKQGLLAGVPDIFIAKANSQYNGFFIEFKFGRGKLTENQKRIICILEKKKYKCLVCCSFDDFVKEVDNYFN